MFNPQLFIYKLFLQQLNLLRRQNLTTESPSHGDYYSNLSVSPCFRGKKSYLHLAYAAYTGRPLH